MAKAPLLLLATFLTLSYSALSEERLGHGHVMAPAPAPEGHHHHHHHHHQAPAPSPTKPPGHHHHHHAPTHSPAQPPTHHHQGPAHAPAMSPTHPPSHHHAPTHAPAVSPTHHHAPTHAPSVTPVHPPSHHHAPAPVHPPTVSPAHPPATPRHFPRSFVAVQGVVYCKSCKYSGADTFQDASPLLGAGVKLVCNNTKYRPVVVQAKTDKNGYFYVEAPKTITSYAAHKCKVSLVSSPLATCSTPSAFRAAFSGALKPQKQFQNQKLPFVLYSVGPFAFEPTCKHN